MTDEELFKLAFKCGIDGDRTSLIQFARQVAELERARCIKAIEKECEDWDRDYKEVALELAGTLEGLK